MTDHWDYFNFSNIMLEATARLKEARIHRSAEAWLPEMDTLEYWIAWSAHANAISTAALLEESK